MKHWIQFFTVAVLGLFLVACGGEKGGSDEAAADIKIPADWVGIYSIDAAESCNGEPVTLNITVSNISYTSPYSLCQKATRKITKVSAEGDSLTVEHDHAGSTTDTFTRVGEQLLVSSSRSYGASGTFKKGLPAEGAGKKGKNYKGPPPSAKAPAAADKTLEIPEAFRGKWKNVSTDKSGEGCNVQITKKKFMFSDCKRYNYVWTATSVEEDEPLYTFTATSPSAKDVNEFTLNLDGEKFSLVGLSYNDGDYEKQK